MKLTIGMMGSSGGALDAAAQAEAYRLGEAIAARDAILITGVCPVFHTRQCGELTPREGLVVGISAMS